MSAARAAAGSRGCSAAGLPMRCERRSTLTSRDIWLFPVSGCHNQCCYEQSLPVPWYPRVSCVWDMCPHWDCRLKGLASSIRPDDATIFQCVPSLHPARPAWVSWAFSPGNTPPHWDSPPTGVRGASVVFLSDSGPLGGRDLR